MTLPLKAAFSAEVTAPAVTRETLTVVVSASRIKPSAYKLTPSCMIAVESDSLTVRPKLIPTLFLFPLSVSTKPGIPTKTV